MRGRLGFDRGLAIRAGGCLHGVLDVRVSLAASIRKALGSRGRFPRREDIAMQTGSSEDNGLFGRGQGPGGFGNGPPRCRIRGPGACFEALPEGDEVGTLQSQAFPVFGGLGLDGGLHIQVGGSDGVLQGLLSLGLSQTAFMFLCQSQVWSVRAGLEVVRRYRAFSPGLELPLRFGFEELYVCIERA